MQTAPVIATILNFTVPSSSCLHNPTPIALITSLPLGFDVEDIIGSLALTAVDKEPPANNYNPELDNHLKDDQQAADNNPEEGGDNHMLDTQWAVHNESKLLHP
jgi:hypothetical protein